MLTTIFRSISRQDSFISNSEASQDVSLASTFSQSLNAKTSSITSSITPSKQHDQISTNNPATNTERVNKIQYHSSKTTVASREHLVNCSTEQMQLKPSSPSKYQNDSLSTSAPSSRSPTQMIPESERKDVNEEPCQLKRTGTFTKYDRRPQPIKMTQLPPEAYHEKHQKAWTKLTAIAKGSNDTYGNGFNSQVMTYGLKIDFF